MVSGVSREGGCCGRGRRDHHGTGGGEKNADAIARRVRGARFDGALIATADDPLLESWLAFMGAASALSLAHPETAFVNLDIGGGTTNVALGINGEVLSAGSFWIGARHLQFHAGTYRIVQTLPPWREDAAKAQGVESGRRRADGS